MRSKPCSDLLYEVPKAQSSAQHLTVLDVSVTWAGPPPGSPGAGPRREPRGGGHRDAPAAPVVERARGRRARRAGGRDGGGGGGRTVSPRARRPRGGRRSLQIRVADGYIAYLTLLNERDGGINGVKLVWEECETVYDVDRGVECYERLKAKGPTGAAALQLANTPLAYALMERATHDQIPLLTHGRWARGRRRWRVFPYVFTAPTTY